MSPRNQLLVMKFLHTMPAKGIKTKKSQGGRHPKLIEVAVDNDYHEPFWLNAFSALKDKDFMQRFFEICQKEIIGFKGFNIADADTLRNIMIDSFREFLQFKQADLGNGIVNASSLRALDNLQAKTNNAQLATTVKQDPVKPIIKVNKKTVNFASWLMQVGEALLEQSHMTFPKAENDSVKWTLTPRNTYSGFHLTKTIQMNDHTSIALIHISYNAITYTIRFEIVDSINLAFKQTDLGDSELCYVPSYKIIKFKDWMSADKSLIDLRSAKQNPALLNSCASSDSNMKIDADSKYVFDWSNFDLNLNLVPNNQTKRVIDQLARVYNLENMYFFYRIDLDVALELLGMSHKQDYYDALLKAVKDNVQKQNTEQPTSDLDLPSLSDFDGDPSELDDEDNYNPSFDLKDNNLNIPNDLNDSKD